MKLDKSLKGLRERQGLTQENVASDIHVSKQLISHFENGRRIVSEDLAKQSVSHYSDAQYGLEVAREISGDYVTPLATANKGVEWHRLALEEVFKHEAAEAIEHFNNISLAKNPDFATPEEIKEIASGVRELLDVQMALNSFLTKLEQAYPFTIKECMQKRLPEWKAKGMIG